MLQPYYQVLVQKYQQKFYPAMYLPIPYQGKSRSEQPAGNVSLSVLLLLPLNCIVIAVNMVVVASSFVILLFICRIDVSW